jgi:hypothetical protein
MYTRCGILWGVSYDSNGDWIADVEVRFSQDLNNYSAISVFNRQDGNGSRLYTRSELVEIYNQQMSKLTKHRAWQAFTEPPEAAEINKARYETTEYREAVQAVLRFRDRRDAAPP